MPPEETHNNSTRLLLLRQLPALTIDPGETDGRGWIVSWRDGRPLGHVSDLLADADSLKADYVIVTIDGTTVPRRGPTPCCRSRPCARCRSSGN